MTEEAKKKAEAERKKLYRQRKKAELEELARQAPDKERERLFNAQARNIAPELEEAFRNAKGSPEIRPMHPLADEPALLADSILNSYTKDFCNTNALLKHILENIILMRLELTDLIGGIRK